MAKNRKRESSLPLTKWVFLCGVIGAIGFGYVFQKNSIKKLGDDIKARELQLELLRKRNVVLVQQVTSLKSPRVIEYKCKVWNLGLSGPKESQIVRVPDPMLVPAKMMALDQLAAVERERSTN
jgi:cell division protein FtsB